MQETEVDTKISFGNFCGFCEVLPWKFKDPRKNYVKQERESILVTIFSFVPRKLIAIRNSNVNFRFKNAQTEGHYAFPNPTNTNMHPILFRTLKKSKLN